MPMHIHVNEYECICTRTSFQLQSLCIFCNFYLHIYIYISSLILPTGELEKCYGIQGLTGTSPRFGSSTGQKTSTASQDAGSTLVGQVLLLDTHTVDGNAAPTGMYKPCK